MIIVDFSAAQVGVFITKPVQIIHAEVFVLVQLVAVQQLAVPFVVTKCLGPFS
jgi:hypothetical protein